MIKNSVKKLIATAICAILALPFLSLSFNIAKAEGEAQKVFKGTDCIISVESVEELKKAKNSEIVIEISNGGAPVIVFDGESKTVTGYTAKFSDSDDEATINFFNNGNYTVTISKKDTEHKLEKSFNVGDTLDYIDLEYSFDEEALNAYKQKVNQEANKGLVVGTDSFTVPNLSSIISTNFPYGNIRKTVYYYAVSDTVSSSNFASKADLKISIKNYGTYRFYVLFDIEKSNLNIDGGKSIAVTGLKEKQDGFYRCSLNGNELYYNSNSNKYFELDANSSTGYGEEVDVTSGTLTEKLIVPVFEFEIKEKAPAIKFTSTYMENGFVGLEYDVPDIEIYGNPTYEDYSLMYRANESASWELVEKLTEGALKFTPEKTGEYKIDVTAYGVNENATASSEIIKVSKAVVSSPYKASFADWLEVNLLPFILLCVSFVCLVAIILLLVIKPKEVKVEVKEEDR